MSVQRALDEARFGPARTLNLRESLPTAAQALARAEAWLRERQMAKAGEVLVITGRGNSSEGGVSVVRAEVERLLARLRRSNVVSEVREHTPGSFVVRLAPISALFEAPRRRNSGPRAATLTDPSALMGLEPETRVLLRVLAVRSLELLGVRIDATTDAIAGEMLRLYSSLSATIPPGPKAEEALCEAIERALEELEEG